MFCIYLYKYKFEDELFNNTNDELKKYKKSLTDFSQRMNNETDMDRTFIDLIDATIDELHFIPDEKLKKQSIIFDNYDELIEKITENEEKTIYLFTDYETKLDLGKKFNNLIIETKKVSLQCRLEIQSIIDVISNKF